MTIVGTGFMVHQALQAARILEKEGIDVEVIDPRTLAPLDKETIRRSVAKTSRLVVVSEDVMTCGVASEISALVAEFGIFSLDAPIKRLSVPDTPHTLRTGHGAGRDPPGRADHGDGKSASKLGGELRCFP